MVWLACMSLEGGSSTALKLCNSMSASVGDTKPRRSMGAFGVAVAHSSSACRGVGRELADSACAAKT